MLDIGTVAADSVLGRAVALFAQGQCPVLDKLTIRITLLLLNSLPKPKEMSMVIVSLGDPHCLRHPLMCAALISYPTMPSSFLLSALASEECTFSVWS